MHRLGQLVAILFAVSLLSGCAVAPKKSVAPPSVTPSASTNPNFEDVGLLPTTTYQPTLYPEQLQIYNSTISPQPADIPPASAPRLAPPSLPIPDGLLYYGLSTAPFSLTVGRNSALWFLSKNTPWFGTITNDGVVRAFAITKAGYRPSGSITMTPDQAIWISQDIGAGSLFGRLGASNDYVQYAARGGVGRLSPAPDNSVWATSLQDKPETPAREDRIVHVNSAGVETVYKLPTEELFVAGRALWGPDGALWFAINGGIGRLAPDGSYSRLRIQGQPIDIGLSPDGNIWALTALGSYQAVLEERSIHGDLLRSQPVPGFSGGSMTVASDGTVWFYGVKLSNTNTGSPVFGRLKEDKEDFFGIYDFGWDIAAAGTSIWLSGVYGLTMFTPPN